MSTYDNYCNVPFEHCSEKKTISKSLNVFLKKELKLMPHYHAVVDPGFPRGGRQPERGCQPIIWPKFAENCMKMKKIEPKGWDRVSKIFLCRHVTVWAYNTLGWRCWLSNIKCHFLGGLNVHLNHPMALQHLSNHLGHLLLEIFLS